MLSNYLEKFRNYHYSILGDMMIYKLTCRGYISIDEAKKKYNVSCFNLKEKVKKVKVKIKPHTFTTLLNSNVTSDPFKYSYN